jgi:hypothetical protein
LSEDSGKSTVTFFLKHYDVCGNNKQTAEAQTWSCREVTELDTFAAAFAVAGENQEKVADEQTPVLLKRFSRNPGVEKAKAGLERAQRVEERFQKGFDGIDFTKW